MAFERIACFVLLSVGLTGCSLAGGPTRPEPGVQPASDASSPSGPRPERGRPAPSPRRSTGIYVDASDAGTALAVVETAFQAIGSPYEWGGTDANGFDCSGLIHYSYGKHGIDLPRISRDQLQKGFPVEHRVGSLQPGDVLGFSAVIGGEPTHVGLYVGDGQFIHSSSNGVSVSDLREPYWRQHLVTARRMVR